MNLTHLHLSITHLPIFGTIIGLLILLYAIYKGSYQVKMVAYTVLFVAAVGGIVSFSTGEAAEETMKSIPEIPRSVIEEHEDFAKITLIAVVGLAGFSLLGAYLTRKRSKLADTMSIIVLIVSLICFVLSSWTGYLGGQIRHSEIVNITLSMQSTGDGRKAIKTASCVNQKLK